MIKDHLAKISPLELSWKVCVCKLNLWFSLYSKFYFNFRQRKHLLTCTAISLATLQNWMFIYYMRIKTKNKIWLSVSNSDENSMNTCKQSSLKEMQDSQTQHIQSCNLLQQHSASGNKNFKYILSGFQCLGQLFF